MSVITRGDNILDLVYTNVPEAFGHCKASNLQPLSDHNLVHTNFKVPAVCSEEADAPPLNALIMGSLTQLSIVAESNVLEERPILLAHWTIQRVSFCCCPFLVMSTSVRYRTRVYRKLYKKDLLNFALCNRNYCEEIIPVLWDYFMLKSGDQLHALNKQNFQHTSFPMLYDLKNEKIDDILTYMSDRLKTLCIHHSINGLEHISVILPSVQSLNFVNVFSHETKWEEISCFSHVVMKIDNCDVNDEHLRKMGSVQI